MSPIAVLYHLHITCRCNISPSCHPLLRCITMLPIAAPYHCHVTHRCTLSVHVTYCCTLSTSCHRSLQYIEGSQPEWRISSMIYSRDTPFWSGTLDISPSCHSSLHLITFRSPVATAAPYHLHVPNSCTLSPSYHLSLHLITVMSPIAATSPSCHPSPHFITFMSPIAALYHLHVTYQCNISPSCHLSLQTYPHVTDHCNISPSLLVSL